MADWIETGEGAEVGADARLNDTDADRGKRVRELQLLRALIGSLSMRGAEKLQLVFAKYWPHLLHFNSRLKYMPSLAAHTSPRIAQQCHCRLLLAACEPRRYLSSA